MRRTKHKSLFWKDINELYDALDSIEFSQDDTYDLEQHLVTGVEMAKYFLRTSNGASDVIESIDYKINRDEGIIFINGSSEVEMLSIYMEYGTGVVGQFNPHRRLSYENYDLNDHGLNGWVYYNKKYGRMLRTTGMPPKSFMYRTYLFLRREIIKSNVRYDIEFVVGDEYTSPSIHIRKLRSYNSREV